VSNGKQVGRVQAREVPRLYGGRCGTTLCGLWRAGRNWTACRRINFWGWRKRHSLSKASRDDLSRERDDWKEQAQRLALAAPITPGSCTGDARTSACAMQASLKTRR
jgi:hypothetical protein